jgi:hypothetical protein
MSTYYMMTCLDPADGYLATLEYDSSADEDLLRDWMAGERFEIQPPQPVRVTRVERPSTVLAEMWQVPVPLMTHRLHAALESAGVANLEVFPAEIVDAKTGTVNTDYVAFNIVGAIAAMVSRPPAGSDLIVGPQLDAAKIAGALLFRLAEAVNAIVVHESVRKAVEGAGIDTLTFLEPQDWAG